MGLRVQVCIGYGLCDLDVIDGMITDDRISHDGWIDAENIYTEEGYKEFLLEHNNMESLSNKDIKSALNRLYLKTFYPETEWSIDNSIIVSDEYVDPGVMLIIPPGYNHWRRYDNIIDYVQATQLEEYSDDWDKNVKILPNGIYPWNDVYVNRRKPDINVNSSFITALKTLKIDNIEISDLLAREAGFQNFHDYKENCILKIPDEVVALCKYLKLFKDESTIYTLKPLWFRQWI